MSLLYSCISSIAQQDGEGILRVLAEIEAIAQLKLLIRLSSLIRKSNIRSKEDVLKIIDSLASDIMGELECLLCKP